MPRILSKIRRNQAASVRAPWGKSRKTLVHQTSPTALVRASFKSYFSMSALHRLEIFSEAVLQFGHEHALGSAIFVCAQVALGHEFINPLHFSRAVIM